MNGDVKHLIGLVSVSYHGRMGSGAEATVKIRVDGNVLTAAYVSENGPVDAVCKAIGEIEPHQAKLKTFGVAAKEESTASEAKTTVVLRKGKGEFCGQAAHADTVVAAAYAYIDALNKLRTFESKQREFVDNLGEGENLSNRRRP